MHHIRVGCFSSSNMNAGGSIIGRDYFLHYRAELESGAPSNVPSAAHELDGHVVGLLAFGDLPGQERIEKGQAHAVAGGHGCAACLLKARHVHHRTSLEVTRTDGQTDARIRTSNERT